jgi:hypothetical protein
VGPIEGTRNQGLLGLERTISVSTTGGPGEKVPAFIIEYKAPHKLSLAHIKEGLQKIELDKVVRYQEEEMPEDICRRVLAAIITQPFSYMIQGGIEHAYVCTAEAFIFVFLEMSLPLYTITCPYQKRTWPKKRDGRAICC